MDRARGCRSRRTLCSIRSSGSCHFNGLCQLLSGSVLTGDTRRSKNLLTESKMPVISFALIGTRWRKKRHRTYIAGKPPTLTSKLPLLNIEHFSCQATIILRTAVEGASPLIATVLRPPLANKATRGIPICSRHSFLCLSQSSDLGDQLRQALASRSHQSRFTILRL